MEACLTLTTNSSPNRPNNKRVVIFTVLNLPPSVKGRHHITCTSGTRSTRTSLSTSTPAVREPANAFRAAADLAGASTFAPPVAALPPGAAAGGAPFQEVPDRGLGQGALDTGLVVGLVGEGGGGGGGAASAGAHGLGDDLELVGAGLVVLLLVLHAAVVLEEEVARLLQHPPTLTDGTETHVQI